MHENKILKYKPILIISIIALISCLIRIYFASQPKIIATLPDEDLYLDMATSLIYRGRLEVRNILSSNTAMLYSLVISPCMLIGNALTRNVVLGIVNSFLLTSTIIPVYLICRRLNYQFKTILVIVVTILFLPDMTMSMTFMSENLFFPLSAWLFYVITLFLQNDSIKNKTRISVILSVITYLCYLTKAISLYYFIAIFLIILYNILNKNLTKELKKSYLYSLLIFSISFLLIKVFVDFFIFNHLFGITNSVYSSSNMSANIINLIKMNNISFFIYSVIFCLFCSIFAFLYFPIIIPLFSFKKMDAVHKNLFLFSILSFFISICVIGFLIHLNESFMKISMRQHLRYYSPLLILFLIMFYKIILEDESKITYIIKNKILGTINLIGTSILFLILFLGIFKFYQFVAVDGVLLQGLNYWGRKFSLANRDYNTFSFLLPDFFIKVFISLFIIIVTVAIYKVMRTKYFIICSLLLICFINNVASIKVFNADYGNYNKSNIPIIKEINLVDNSIKKLNGNILYISGNSKKVAETYITAPIYYTDLDAVINLKGDKNYIDLKTNKILCSYPSLVYENLDKVDYILTTNNIRIINAVKINLPEVSSFCLYKNIDSAKIYVERESLFPSNIGETLTLDTSNTEFHTQGTIKRDGSFTSTENNTKALLFGPYKYTKNGKFKVSFYYDYIPTNKIKQDEIGFIDICDGDEIINRQPIFSGMGYSTFDEVNLNKDYLQLQLRLYTTVKGVTFHKIEVTCLE